MTRSSPQTSADRPAPVALLDAPAVLVTGGAGYIGSHACKALAAAGYRPICYDNLTLGHRRAVKWGPLVVADVLDGVQLRAAMRAYRVTAVMHFAASAYVGESVRDPAHYYRNNLTTTLALLDAMLECGVTDLVLSSSCAVYGNPAVVPIYESHAPAPLSPYGQTKLDAENAVRWYSRAYGLRSIALRYFNAAGADPDGETGEDHDPETRLVPRAIFAATGRGPPLEIYGDDWPTRDGTAIRDYVHVSDLADAHVAALRVLPRDTRGEPLNLGTGRGSSVREVIEAVSRATGHTVPRSVAARRDGDPAEVVAAPAQAEQLLEWTARRSSIDEIVRTAVRWHARPR